MLRLNPLHQLVLVALVFTRSATAQQASDTMRVCLAPTSARTAGGNADAAVNAVRETFTAFLTGPSLATTPLTSRLASQAREEAKLGNCPYLLLTTLEHERKEGRGIFGRAVGSAVETGAWTVFGATTSTGARIAAGAAVSAAAAARELATTVRSNDRLTLSYRLENPDGKVLLEKSESAKQHPTAKICSHRSSRRQPVRSS